MASRLARKVRRTGKTAVQFRFSTKFEYIDLQLNGTWRPDKLRVIWLRSHRRAQTIEVTWAAKTDSGPNGAVGRAVFDPPITAALLVTLYRDGKKAAFDSKDYKYFVENEGPGGKKILASITVDLAEYAGMPSSRHPLELTCKSVSKKVNEAIIGATIESEFIKQGDSNDDDMQSTFSALSAGQESLMFDEEDDDDELDEAATMNHSHQSNGITTVSTKAAASTTVTEDPSAPLPANSKPLGTQSSNSTINSVSPMDLMLLQPSQTSSTSIESTCITGVPSSSLKQPDTAETKKMSVIDEKIEEEDEGTKSDVPPAKEQSPPVAVNSTVSATEKPQKKEEPKNEKKEDKETTQQQTQTHSKPQPQPQTEPQAQARTEPQPQSHTEPKTQPHTEPQTQAKAKKTQAKAQTQPQPQAPKQLTQQQAQPHYDFAYEMSMMLAVESSPKSNHSVQSHNKSNNPFDESMEVEPTVSVRDVWLPGLELVDLKEASVNIERIEKACVIGLYFSAEWCPPCRRFLPKLTKFYNIMKENSRSFEVIYVTNDNTRTEALKYMQDQQMPWPALPHGHPLIDKLKEEYKIKSIPMLTIVASSNGEQLDDNGKKSVEGASSASSAMKLFSKWLDKAGITPEEEVERGKKGFIGTVKKAFNGHDHSGTKSVDTEEHREQVQASKRRKSKSSNSHDQCASLLLEKDEKIRDLNERNTALEQTNKDLNEEAVELKKKIRDLENKMDVLQKSAHDLEAEKERVRAQTELTGWLCKRGVRGPTANVWRRRYFRLDQGSKLYYYKSSTEGTPQGFIDLVKVVDVSEVSAAQQDKNHATFHVLVEGRTFQLQAMDEPNMRKWMDAISYLKDYYQKRS